MVTVSSNINIYSNQFQNYRFTTPIADNLSIKDYSQNILTNELDKFDNSKSQATVSYTNEIQTKVKQNIQKINNQQNEISPEEKKEIEQLQKTDQKVRAHEQAHLAAGAGLVRGGATFEYTRGPDGKMYAVGGEVKIDISPVNGKPEETIRKMQNVISAALAPVDPSPQDRAVATIARNIQAKAQMEKSEQARKRTQSKDSSDIIANNQSNQPIERETSDNIINQKKYTNSRSKVIKQYIINNPYQDLDKILFKSV